ncbi:hypothetical protein GV819_28705 [Pseudomonas sp. Fl5BN2]|uniref:hypothetical protein n=1 Tax=Pseudomonas sp. Fl5BN2 TaxID=2697652 RepID=UPI001377074F|nr:hypothetical protein [Pseudomonas sp. Fl5BN2]NBF06267.1 hypothetical protein [Pseudomonas sp. Fl5BN2]
MVLVVAGLLGSGAAVHRFGARDGELHLDQAHAVDFSTRDAISGSLGSDLSTITFGIRNPDTAERVYPLAEVGALEKH